MHDGPGIRTTVFLKGCSLHCPWCSNPENILSQSQYYYDQSKCKLQNGICILFNKCPVCRGEPVSSECCPVGAIGVYGKTWDAEELYEETIKDRAYWGNDGGITFSGGEPLLQMQELTRLMKLYQQSGIGMAMETALFVDGQAIRAAREYISFIYADVKILDEKNCREVLGGDIKKYLSNMEILLDCYSEEQVTFRVPCSTQYVLARRNRDLLLEFFMKHSRYPIEIFRIHALGKKKYETMGKKAYQYEESEEIFQDFYNTLIRNNLRVKILSV